MTRIASNRINFSRMESATMTAPAEQRLSELTLFARAIGYRVRHEHLDGCGGGLTTFNGMRWILLDDMQTAEENVRILLGILREDTASLSDGMRPRLQQFLSTETPRKAA